MAFYGYNTFLGKIYIAEKNNKISQLCFGYAPFFNNDVEENTPLLQQAFIQICEYLNGYRKYFNLSLDPQGTVFQKKVWKELCNIPYGETVSYKFIAEKINHPNSYRAIGRANNKNPIPIIIPCHRVIGINGNLVGYAGGLQLKRKLLQIEALNY